MTERSQTLRNTLFSSISIYTEYFIGMLTSILIARHMGPGDYGVYGLVVWMGGLGVAFINAGLASASIKFIAQLRGAGQEELLAPLIRRLRWIQRGLTLLVVVAGAATFHFSHHRLAPALDWESFALLLVAIALRAPYMLNMALAKGFEDFRALAGVAIIAAPINLAMIIVAVWLDVSLEGYVLIYAISGLIFLLVSQLRVHGLLPADTANLALPDDLLNRLYRYLGIVAITGMVSFFTASEVEVLFLNLWNTPEAAGNFRVAHQLAASAALLVPGVFAALMLPMMSKAYGAGIDQARERFAAVTRYLLLLAAPLVAFAITLAHDTTHALYGSAYDPAGIALTWCLAACALTTVGSGASSLLLGADRQLSMLLLTLFCAACKLTAGAWLAAHYGLAGAIASYVGVAMISLTCYIVLAVRASGARLPWLWFVRIVLAATFAGIPAWIIGHTLAPWPALLIGGPLLLIGYVFFSLALGCWGPPDVAYVRRLIAGYTRGRHANVEGFLDWAEKRAHWFGHE
jgi:O-antigen/teichoic acid export membrane protein